jgi:tyrosyl-tRNA synthetase
VALTTPLLLSWDGEKMSSSMGNNIPLTAPAEEIFGRTMRIPDSMLEDWWRLVAEGPVPAGEPLEAKLELARLITARSWGAAGARAGEEHFTRVVREGRAPDDVPEATFSAENGVVYLPGLLQKLAGESASHWRRQIDQGGVKVDGGSPAGYEVAAATLDGALLQAGKRRYFRLRSA